MASAPALLEQAAKMTGTTAQELEALVDEANAIHESGHAVITLLLGITLHYVWLNDPSGGEEFGECARLDAPDYESEILIEFAGVGTELIHRKMGRRWSFLFASLGRGDWREAQWRLERMGGNRKALVRVAKSRVTQLLEDNWSWVLAVSQRLRKKRYLSGAEVAALSAELATNVLPSTTSG
jgi:hypothetical protein